MQSVANRDQQVGAGPSGSSAGQPPAVDGMTPLAYRAALDGLRTVAVYLVVAFHADVRLFSGGFIGVDVFFVLSGYLITRVVLGGLATGSFGVASFYSRRFRRLLPASLVVLGAVTLAWVVVASPFERGAVLSDIRAAALYVSNWHFAAESTEYFALQDSPSPVLHFWSLSVEEQFYFVWPLLMVWLWKAGDRSPLTAARRVGAAAAGLSVLSLLALWWTLHAGADDLAYYGTHTRAYQLLGGGLLAVGLQFWAWSATSELRRSIAPVVQVVALAAIFFLATDIVGANPSVRGIGAAIATISLIWSLETATGSSASGLLGRPGLVYLGQLSYATYLWHFPTTILIRRYVEMGPTLLFVVAALVSTGLAAVSQRIIELPVRSSPWLDRRGRTVIVGGLVASLLAGVFVFPMGLRTDARPTVRAAGGNVEVDPSEQRTSLEGFDPMANWEVPAGSPSAGPGPADRSCTGGVIADCVLHDGGGRRVLLLGDSHAGMLAPALRAIAKDQQWTLVMGAKTGCPWPTGLVFVRSDHEVCRQTKQSWYESVIPQFRPELVILASRATDHRVGSEYPVAAIDPEVDDASQSTLLLDSAARTIRQLAADGTSVVVIEPVPVSPVHAIECLSGARFVDECNFTADGASEAEIGLRRVADELPQVHVVDIDPLVCPRLPVCDSVLGGMTVRKDRDHITPRWSSSIAPGLQSLLSEAGVL